MRGAYYSPLRALRQNRGAGQGENSQAASNIDAHTINIIDGQPVEVPGLEPIPFTGEVMTCVLCGKTRRSDPQVSSNWRMFRPGKTGPAFYACAGEFPPDEADKEAFTAAYIKFFKAAVIKYRQMQRIQARINLGLRRG